MRIATTIADARAAISRLPGPVGLVPTMGALHGGHMRLVEIARKTSISVVTSLFVNPLQFGPQEDLGRYPRDIEGDKKKLADAGVDVVFVPSVEEMYPDGFSTTVDVGILGTVFEGAIRPEHFRGVATVLTKLLNIVQPDALYLGQKDAQQTAVIRKLVTDLAIPTKLHVVPTAREADGLAMSSRNAYLNPEERAAAPNLFHALQMLHDTLAAGSSKEDAVAAARQSFIDSPGVLDYLDAVDANTFEPIERLCAPAFIIGSAHFGTTRLIDNLWISA